MMIKLRQRRPAGKNRQLLDEIAATAERLGDLVQRVKNANRLDQRWVALAEIDLQKGIMSLKRGVKRPEGF